MAEHGPNITFEEERDRTNASKLPCIVGFGMDGVFVGSNQDKWTGPIEIECVLQDMAYDAGEWRPDLHPRMLADTTGNGRKDIVGFGRSGVWIAKNSGAHSFTPSQLVVQCFGCDMEWRSDQHIRLLADLRGKGRVDIFGIGHAGVFVSLNSGDGNYSPVQEAVLSFGTTDGWKVDKHPRLLADITGDGLPDIIGFGETQTFVARSRGDGTFDGARPITNLDGFSFLGGWRVESHLRLMVDLTGNGTADVIGFKSDGIFVSLNDGQGNFSPMKFALDDFGVCQGWQTALHLRFVLPLKVNGVADIIGFGNEGVYVAMNNGDGTFAQPKLVLPDFGIHQGWKVDRHPRFLVDLTGSGCPDIIGLGETAIFVSFNDGSGLFGPVQKLGHQFTASRGWLNDKTVRYVTTL